VLQDAFAWNPLDVIPATGILIAIARRAVRVGLAEMFWSEA
jgi:hypothetical protein